MSETASWFGQTFWQLDTDEGSFWVEQDKYGLWHSEWLAPIDVRFLDSTPKSEIVSIPLTWCVICNG